MVTFLGIVCMAGAIWFGLLCEGGSKRCGWDFIVFALLKTMFILTSLACLVLAFVCFGGKL